MDKVCFEQSGSSVHMRKNCNGAPLAKEEITMMQKVASIALVVGLIGACAFAQGVAGHGILRCSATQ